MWGGVKKRTHYGDLFKKWSATRGLEELRIKLYKEPRPWYLAYSLHQCNHLLQDHHCARLLAWSTSVVELQPSLAGKQQAYRYTHEAFQLLVRHHKVGAETLHEFLRLCAVGADLTSAFDWCKYWREAHLDGGDALSTLTWLLCVARAAPSDERAEDVALTVLELYRDRFGGVNTAAGEAEALASSPPQLSSLPVEAEDQNQFFSVFKSLEPRVQQNAVLRDFLRSLPLSHATAVATCAEFGWPSKSSHCLFPQLELHQHVPLETTREEMSRYASAGPPRLRDSLLHADFVARLETSAASKNVGEVVALVEAYERGVREEQARTREGDRPSGQHRRSSRSSRDDTLWRSCGDASAFAFRKPLVQRGGVTPELYHYLITALATVQPSVALTTLTQMAEANLRPLDLTRAAVVVAVADSPADQRRLFQQQLDDIEARVRLDSDNDTVTAAEAYWKYDYVAFFHYRNALTVAEFYLYLMARMGPQAVQQLLLDVQRHGPLATKDDLVVLDEDLRNASRFFFRSRVGRAAVQNALDTISHHQPKLDISLVGTVPHFENYYVEEADAIAHSEAALQTLVQPYDVVYVLDTSFIETSEAFLGVGKAGAGGNSSTSSGKSSNSLVLVPYLSLAQLAASVSGTEAFTSFDPALQQAIRSEPFLASQRLRSLFAMVASSPSATRHSRHARVLHFTECLCANQVEQAVLDRFGLAPATNDNDQLLLVLAMLSCLKSEKARLVLCTDDAQLVEQLEALQHCPLFGSAVEVVSTSPPANLDLEQNLIDDNPIWRDGLRGEAESFVPRLNIAADVSNVQSGGDMEAEALLPESDAPTSVASVLSSSAAAEESSVAEADVAVESPWLALLEEDGDGESGSSAVTSAKTVLDSAANALATTTTSSPATSSAAAADQELRDRLMSLYETPFDVVPIGVRMEEASAVGSVFDEFDSMDPQQREEVAAHRAAAHSRLSPGEGGEAGQPRRRRSALEREMLSNRGYSNKDRRQLARQLSNRSGGRVPFNMRYRVVEANVRDPRNAHLRQVYAAGLEKKRSSFKRRQGR